jgi:hypothetical protein
MTNSFGLKVCDAREFKIIKAQKDQSPFSRESTGSNSESQAFYSVATGNYRSVLTKMRHFALN